MYLPAYGEIQKSWRKLDFHRIYRFREAGWFSRGKIIAKILHFTFYMQCVLALKIQKWQQIANLYTVTTTYTFPLQKHNDVILQNYIFRSQHARGQNALKSVYINLKRIYSPQNRKKKSHGSFCTQNSIID